MAKKNDDAGFVVRATAMGFYDSLREVGSKFRVRDEEAFAPNWMERLEAKEAASASHDDTNTGLGFVIKHVPAGKYVVLNKEGERVSRVFTKEEGNAKDLATAEAIRLNAGGEPVMPGPSGGGAVPKVPEEEEDETLPDA